MCSDSVGVSAESYITLNIQPKTAIRTSEVVQVKNQHVELKYNIEEVENEQVAADNELFSALEVVNVKKAVVATKKQVVALATLKHNKATNSLQLAKNAYNVAMADKTNAMERVRLA